MGTYYNGNEIDTTTKETLGDSILGKVVKQELDSKVFDGVFGTFTKDTIDTGNQYEEIEVGNLTSDDFDATGAEALTKKKMDFKSLYHKINRRKTFKATVSDAQVKPAMLNTSAMASLSNAIVNEIYNSSAIEDYEAFKRLLKDVAGEDKVMTICDLNGNGDNMDSLTKTIQTLATNMTFPSTRYNFSGFKKAFNSRDELVLIIDSATSAKLNVDSLASAFNMSKKELVGNIIVVDELPDVEFTSEACEKQCELEIGADTNVIVAKPNESGDTTITGKVLGFLVSKASLIRSPIERELTDQYNAKGRFTNYYYHVTDILSYSTLKNAVALVD